jgi:putative aldouronate transport system substrate-binding protein
MCAENECSQHLAAHNLQDSTKINREESPMRSTGKKAVLLIPVSGLLFTALLGCQPVGSKQSEEAKDVKESPSVGKFKILFDYNIDPSGLDLLDNKYTQFLKEKTGVDVGIEYPGSTGYTDKLNIRMASGNYPDAAMMQDANKIKQFARDEILTDLTPYFKDQAKYPNISKYLPESAVLPITDGGKIWAFPANRADAFHQVVYIRKDWLEKLNMKVPKTLEEYHQVLKAFTEKDPDGNIRTAYTKQFNVWR